MVVGQHMAVPRLVSMHGICLLKGYAVRGRDDEADEAGDVVPLLPRVGTYSIPPPLPDHEGGRLEAADGEVGCGTEGPTKSGDCKPERADTYSRYLCSCP